jgi:hypothetical protein
MKLFFIITLFISVSISAGPIRYLQTRYYKNDYLLESRAAYDFAACDEHLVTEEEYYYLKCEGTVLTPQDNLDDFFSDMNAIRLITSEEKFLEDLQIHVKDQLNENDSQMKLLKRCLQNLDNTDDCKTAKENILEMLRRDLPRLRILMAQKSFPGVIFSPTKPQRFRNELNHSISGISPKPLTADEVTYLEGHTDTLEAAFTQDVYRENEVDGLNECLDRNNESLSIKDSRDCERFDPIANYRASLKFNEQNEIYENEYNNMIEANPLLTLLTVNGQESDHDLFENIVGALDKLIEDSGKAIANVEKLRGDDRVELLGYKQAVNTMLSSEDEGASRISCDIAQKLSDKNNRSEMMTDIYIGLGAVAGGGLCAFTGVGLFGCSIGVGLATEGVALAVAQRRHEVSQSAFFAGIGSTERTETNEFSRNLSLYLLPLSMASEGAMQAARILRRTPSATHANRIDNVVASDTPRVPAQSERRYNFEGRQEIDEINRELGSSRKRLLLNTYNAGNKHDLSRMDETYFSGLADILEYRLRQDFPDLTEAQINVRLSRQLDDLVKSCKGN